MEEGVRTVSARWLRDATLRGRVGPPSDGDVRVYVRALRKSDSKVLPLPKSKPTLRKSDVRLPYSRLLERISETNARSAWRDEYETRVAPYAARNERNAFVRVEDHDRVLLELVSRVYGCEIASAKPDGCANVRETVRARAPPNVLPAICTVETETHVYVIHRLDSESTLKDCVDFSPALLERSYSKRLFVIYQLLHSFECMHNRGVCVGEIGLEDVYVTENLRILLIPSILNGNLAPLASEIVRERSKIELCDERRSKYSKICKHDDNKRTLSRSDSIDVEKVCNLWIRGLISNLDYLIHLNVLAGRESGNPKAHHVVPWVTDFSSRCGKQWRDLTKSKYRLNKGDRQLDMTYDIPVKDMQGTLSIPQEVPHHVSDVISDITYYVYMARRTPKDVLCQHVRQNWVPAEYPNSIQRLQEWTPDECIPEFFTDPLIFKSIHEDLPDLEIPAWTTCVEDFIVKHREALESIQVSETLHHWIDLTFGYKLSGTAAIKAKNVCLSLVDHHIILNKTGPVQLFHSPHPARLSPRTGSDWGEKLPPRILLQKERKNFNVHESSDDISDDEILYQLQNVSSNHLITHNHRNKSGNKIKKCQRKNEIYSEDFATSPIHSNSLQHFKGQKSEFVETSLLLPKDYNPISKLTTVESIHNFKMKTFYSNNFCTEEEKNIVKNILGACLNTSENALDICNYSNQRETNCPSNKTFKEGIILKASNRCDSKESFKKEKRNRDLNIRLVTDVSLFKKHVSLNREKDMQILGCLIVELFLYEKMRPFFINKAKHFTERYKICKLVFENNINVVPKCVGYVIAMLFRIDLNSEKKTNVLGCTINTRFPCIDEKGLPSPSFTQFLQPLLSNNLFPFPTSFSIFYEMITVLNEYYIAEKELDVICSFDCDGQECLKFQSQDKTKFYFIQKIAEGKVYSASLCIQKFLNQTSSYNQFDDIHLFIPHFLELLSNRYTSILAVWYLFDPIAKVLGPIETSKQLLPFILNIYSDHIIDKCNNSSRGNFYNSKKSVKLYHHIFVLQLIVRFGLQCFLDNFIPHLVEAVGGYKDFNCFNIVMHSHKNDTILKFGDLKKKFTYCDELKITSNASHDIISPDTSCGSEVILSPYAEKESVLINENQKSSQCDRIESGVFDFENDSKDSSSSNVCDTDHSKNCDFNKTKIKCLLEEIDLECSSPTTDLYINHTHAIEATELTCLVQDISFETHVEEVNIEKHAVSKSNVSTPIAPIFVNTFTSYLQVEEVNESSQNSNSTYINNTSSKLLDDRHKKNEESPQQENVSTDIKDYKISEMSSETLIWLAHRLGPVLTCKYVTKNLLKMLALCYMGQENLLPLVEETKENIDCLSIASGRILGDKNALKVIECLTSISSLYGEQLILLQYFPHMGDLIASCRKRITPPLEGGIISCLQLLKYLILYLSDVKLMEQLQDIILKNILHPTVRLISSTRLIFPDGYIARSVLAKKFLETLYIIAVRIGPEMTRKHLCVPALQRFCLSFDRAFGETTEMQTIESDAQANFQMKCQQPCENESSIVEICRDGTTTEWHIKDGIISREVESFGDLSSSPSQAPHRNSTYSALNEIKAVFSNELAYQTYIPFAKLVGEETMERSLKNCHLLKKLCQEYKSKVVRSDRSESSSSVSFTDYEMETQLISNSVDENSIFDVKDTTKSKSIVYELPCNIDETSNANSFGSKMSIVGNRIDVQNYPDETNNFNNTHSYLNVLDIVSCKMDSDQRSNRHLRGNWLIYWEHEIGRPEKDMFFNLKQIKLQTFTSHTHSVRCIIPLDNENSFITGSKDKTIKLWSLRNQGDGNVVSNCQWTYAGHRKGVLSVSFLESLRLIVSTDSVVHIWDPYVENTIAQMENHKTTPVSIVKAMAAPSSLILAATTDTTLKIIDSKTCTYLHDLKVTLNSSTFIRCICVSPSGKWIVVGLATGHLSLLDPRTGVIINHWKGHEGEVLQLVTINENNIVSSSLDQTISVWSTIDGRLKFQLKGSTEPVHCLAAYYNELISGTTNNRIGVHTSIDKNEKFCSIKLKSDTFKGVLTSMAVLPLNRMLLLGSEVGNVTLLC